MSHLWTGRFVLLCRMCCQGDPPFGSTQSRCPIFGLVGSFFYVACVVKVTHLSAAPSQDLSSLDRFILLCRMCCQGDPPSAAPSPDVTSLDWFILSFVTCCHPGILSMSLIWLVQSFFCHLHVYHTRIPPC